MNPSQDSPTQAQLLAESGWLRRLAGRLVDDHHLADDLTQQALTQALDARPGILERPRAWLAQVLRNTWRQEQRSAARRKQREQHGRSAESAPEPWEVLQRLQAQEDLVAALRDLPEPQRSALVLRYFDEASPAQIARQQGLTRRQVYATLERGLTQLRSRLDARHGSRRAWVLSFLPLLPRPWPWLTPPVPPLIMSGKPLTLGTLLVSVLALGAWYAYPSASSRAVGPAEPSPAGAAQAGGQKPAPGAGAQRRSVPQPLARKTAKPSGSKSEVLLRVLGLDAQPLPDVGVQLVSRAQVWSPPTGSGSPRASDANGRVRLVVAESGKGYARIVDPQMTTVFAATIGLSDPAVEAILVAGPRRSLRGRVIDADGAPVADARVEVMLPRDLRARFAEVLDFSVAPRWRDRSDADGQVDLGTIAAVPGAEVLITHNRYPSRREPLPRAESGLVWTLQPAKAEPGSLSGQVLDAGGQPVVAALVGLGGASTRSDAQGQFLFRASQVDRSARLIALKPGFLPAMQEEIPADQAFVTLRLGGAAQQISGLVRDERGRPLPGVQVWIKTATAFARHDGGAASVEGLLSGGLTRRQMRAAYREQPQGTSVLAFLKSVRRADWPSVRSDAQGRFRIGGLLERSYQLVAMDPATLQRTESEAHPAGTSGLLLVLDKSRLFAEVRGRVVDRQGGALAGVRVAPQIDAFQLQLRRLGRDEQSTQHSALEATRSDAEGRFVLRRIPRSGVYLRLDGATILPREFGRGLAGGFVEAAGGLHLDFDLPVSVRVHVQLLSAGSAATAVEFLDAEGQVLTAHLFQGDRRRSFRLLPLRASTSPVIVVPDRAVQIRLRKDGKPLDTRPLQLRAGSVNKIQL